jgi:hypothetical protein
MPGLAATLGAATPVAAEAIAGALAARGRDLATWRAGRVQLAVRAEMPAVHEFPDGALAVAGQAAASQLATGYAHRGPLGLLAPEPAGPYAVVLADLARDALVLARYGDGPPLYWARHGPAVLVASEPVALLAAGVPAAPDPAVVARFLATGACDDTAATFFAGVRRVLPGQLVEVRTGPAGGPDRLSVRVQEASPTPPAGAEPALAAAVGSGRFAVRLGCGVGAAAVLGVALGHPDRPRPLPVYSTTFPELTTADSSAYCASALLAPYVLGVARHRALPIFADDVDVDGFLADLGEPVPWLADWLCWTVARRVAGEVDALVDSAAGAHLGRLADRVASRYGVEVRLPLRDMPEPARPAGLAPLVRRLLPSAAAGFALSPAAGRGGEAVLADLLRRLRVELVTTFLDPRAAGSDGLPVVLALLAGERVDAPALWRRYLVERWLRTVVEPAAATTGQPDAGHRSSVPAGGRSRSGARGRSRSGAGGRSRSDAGDRAPAPAPARVTAGGRRWERRPVHTELLAAGDKLPEKLAWYLAEATPGPAGPWYALLAAKPVAVLQGRARDLWEIRPGRTARLLARLAGRRTGPAASWAYQVAIEEGGWLRLLAAVLAGAAGGGRWYGRLAGPAVRAIRPPRPDAAPPGQVSVVPAPVDPDRVAADVVAALRTALPLAGYASLGGCAVVGVAGDLLGWAGRPGAAPPPPGLLPALATGDPFGDDHTPIVLVTPAPAPAPRRSRRS